MGSTTMKVVNPRTGEVDYAIVPATDAEVAAEAGRLRSAQPEWRGLGALGRAEVLIRWADAIDGAAPELTDLLSIDTGRIAIARIEVASVAGMLRRWAARAPGAIAAFDRDDEASVTPGIRFDLRRSPYPLLGVIAPWNFPLLLALVDAIPALAAGCAALIKPSEVTPRFIPALRRTVEQVPELAAVVALVEGDAVTGRAIVEHVDYVCFTGSVATGRKVAEAAARAFIPANLELGGKDPLIVLASADPVAAASVALRASVAANGQACQSIERVYVAREIAESFVTALVAGAKAVRLNYPDIAVGEVGPFIFPPQSEKVAAQIADAVAKGARVLAGGNVETLGGGKYLRPTVLVDVKPDMAVMREETFGPVMPVTIYDDIEEAVRLANASEYGLSAAIIGDPHEASKIATKLEAGAISINDASLTAMVSDAENSSFKLSGMGPSRMGDTGLTRFFRTQALIRQTGTPLPIAAYAEDAKR